MGEIEKIITLKGNPMGTIRLGKLIKISPKSMGAINSPGYQVEYVGVSVSVLVGIGKDHTAELTMSVEAWKVLTK